MRNGAWTGRAAQVQMKLDMRKLETKSDDGVRLCQLYKGPGKVWRQILSFKDLGFSDTRMFGVFYLFIYHGKYNLACGRFSLNTSSIISFEFMEVAHCVLH